MLGEVDGWPAVGTEVMVERSEERAGGSAGNAALALSGMGVPHVLLASTGTDGRGDVLRAAFAADTSRWHREPGPTTLTVAVVHRGGDRAFLTTPGHLDTTPADALIAMVPDAPPNGIALVAGAFLMPSLHDDRLNTALRERGWRVAVDPGWPPGGWTSAALALARRWIEGADYALVNADEALALTGAAAPSDALARLAVRGTCVVKDGADGAWARDGSKRVHVPAPAVDVIDTVGAGDTFDAAFLHAVTAGRDLEAALREANRVAASAISTFPRAYGEPRG